MIIERTKNAKINIIFGFLLKVYQIIVPFFMRTIIISSLGVEYLGLNSLFTSVLQVLNLAELGVGSAMVFSMYKPITIDDNNKICALMNLYKKYYNIIGVIVLTIGLLLLPFIPFLIKSNLPNDVNIYVLYSLNLLATVLSYWLFAYKNSVLQAHQRQDVISKIAIIVNTCMYLLQIVSIWFMHNYYFFVVLNLLGQISINIITAIVSTRLYPNFKAKGVLDKIEIKEINQRVKDLFTSKLGSVVLNSVDTIVISAFLGLTTLAIYQNYYYIITAIIGVLSVVFSSCMAGIGNSIIVESRTKNYNDLKKFTFLIVWIATICTGCFLNLFQPFMELWVGKDLLLDYQCVICLAIYFYIYEINMLLNTYKDAAGIWHKDKYRPLITAIANVMLNLTLVNFIGIYGIILSTVLTILLIGMPWLIHNLFSELFKMNTKEYVISLLKYTLCMIIISIISCYICTFIKGSLITIIAIRGIISVLLALVIWWLLFKNTKEMKECKNLIKRMLKL